MFGVSIGGTETVVCCRASRFVLWSENCSHLSGNIQSLATAPTEIAKKLSILVKMIYEHHMVERLNKIVSKRNVTAV